MDLRCQYASTHCPNTRSLKISGELHRFCLFHRRSANAAQRRWKQKKLTDVASSSGQDCSKIFSSVNTRRRLRTETTGESLPHETPAKRRRQNHQVAGPRLLEPSALIDDPAILSIPVVPPAAPAEFALDDLPPPVAFDALLDELIASVDGSTDKNHENDSDGDCWWTYQQGVGVIV